MLARDHRSTARTVLVSMIVLFLGLGPARTIAADDDLRLLLAVVINDHPTNRIGEFVQRQGALFARPEELHSLGLKAQALAAAKDGLVALSDIHDVGFRLD